MIKDRKPYDSMRNQHFVICCDNYTIGVEDLEEAISMALKEIEKRNTGMYQIYDRVKKEVVSAGTIGQLTTSII